MTLRWLHLSDLHLPSSHTDGYRSGRALEALLESLARRNRNGEQFDVIFCTGDIAERGLDYSRATQFFDQLLESTGLISRFGPEAKRRLYLVPGNHDVDRTKARFLLRTLTSEDESIEFFSDFKPEARANHFKRFESFEDFFNGYFKGIRHLSNQSHWYADRLDHAANGQRLRVGVIGLNSCAFSQDDDDERRLWIGVRTLHSAFAQLQPRVASESCHIVFVLQHHPIEWLHVHEQSSFRAHLFKGADVLLFGHLHSNDTQSISNQYGSTLLLQAGATYENSARPLRVLMGLFDAEQAQVTVTPLCFLQEGRFEWTIDPSLFPDCEGTGFSKTFTLARVRGVPAALESPSEARLPRTESTLSDPRGVTIVVGDRREALPETPGDFFAATPSTRDLTWLLSIGLSRASVLWTDKVLLSARTHEDLPAAFRTRDLLVVGSPYCNHLARLLNKSAPFPFRIEEEVLARIEEKEASIRGLPRHQGELQDLFVGMKGEYEQLLMSLRGLGFSDPILRQKGVGAHTGKNDDYAAISLCPNPFSVRHSALFVAGLHLPGTMTAVRCLAASAFFAKHPFGGVIKVAIADHREWYERLMDAQPTWVTPEYTIETFVGADHRISVVDAPTTIEALLKKWTTT